MIKKLALCAITLGSLGIDVAANAAAEDGNKEHKTLELIEKAEALSQVSDEDILVVDGYEVVLGEAVSATESIARNSLRMTGNVSVSRPIIGGVMTATATTTANRTVHQISVRANVNNNGTSMSHGVWRRLNNTTFVSASRSGTSRRGIGHGNHEAKSTPSSIVLSANTTNRQFQ